MYYYWCCVSECRSSTIKTPEKLWFRIPTNAKMRKIWLKLARRDPNSLSSNSPLFFCEDHFNLENDMENYMEYKIMGSVKRILKKPNCIPTKFDCFANSKYKSTPIDPLPAFKEREHALPLIADAEETLKGGIKPPSSHKPGTLSERQQLKQVNSQITSSQEILNSSEYLKSAMKGLISTINDSIETTDALPQEDVTLECRACYQKFDFDAGLIHLFQSWNPPWNGMAETIAEDLSKLTSIEVSFADTYSKYICLMCHQKLLDACNFVANVRQNDRVFREKAEEYSRQDTIWPKPIQINKDVNSLILHNSMVVEVKQEVLSEDEADVNGMDDMYKESDFNSLDIKVEPEEIVEQPSIQITVNGTITNDQYAQNSMVVNGDCMLEDQNIEEVKVKEEPISEDEDLGMVPDLPLECMLCMKSFNSVSGLKAHVVSQHSYKSVKRKTDGGSSPKKKNRHICVTCRCSFATSTDLMVHETRHNAYACYVCNDAKFDTFELLTKHRKKCKSAGSKTVQRPKTLEDVKRPQVSSPPLSQTSTPDYVNDTKKEDIKCTPSVEVHFKIQSISEQTNIVDSDLDTEMKVEPLDSSFSEDEVIN